jgi:hypothetical protein
VARSLGRTLSSLAVTVGLTLASAGTAAAQEFAVTDARGDVQAFVGESNTPTAAPDTKNGDIVRTVFRHNDRRISVRVKFVDLLRTGQFNGHVLRIVTNEKLRRDVTVMTGPNFWRGTAEMSRPNGTPVDCEIQHKIAYDTNVVTLSFPRSCVSDPRWVRLGLGSVTSSADGSKGYLDDAQLSGRVNPETVKLSGRIRRG